MVFNIWRVNADGTGLRLITNTTAASASNVVPQWSPDGTKIVFYSSRKLDGSDAPNANGTYNIWRVNADGSGLTALTNATLLMTSSFDPQWSPSGTRVAFYSGRKLDGTDAPNLNNTTNIWRVNADGTGLTPLTNVTANGANSVSPRFSP
jgi:TolB protein